MAKLIEASRDAVSGDYQRKNLGNLACTKHDIRAAIAGLDDFLDDNQSAINQAIPQPARGALTTNQKIWALMFVLQRRLADRSDG